MDSLLAARLQMEVSLAFHMIFAGLGVGMPLVMLIAEWQWLRKKESHYLTLAKRWGKTTTVTFAVGAVSGTALSFELGLLWPKFMSMAGSTIGPAFALEGFAFFLEAIYLSLYLYGWERLSGWAHWWTGVAVAISGAASSILVVATNAWMQHPVGLDTLLRNPEAVKPVSMLFLDNPVWKMEAVHSTLATYAATGFAVAGIYAFAALRGNRSRYTLVALRIAMIVGTVAAILMPVTGHVHAQLTAKVQPAKLAAMESLFQTETRAPLIIGGIPDPKAGVVRYAVGIPGGLSFLAHGKLNAEVTGLDQFPRDEHPNVVITHLAFQLMVAAGFAMVAVAAWFWLASRKLGLKALSQPWLMRTVLLAAPLGFIALEAGWIVTEAGRQPWIVYGSMRTADAVVPTGNVLATFIGFSALYLFLAVVLASLLLRLIPENGK